MLSKLRLGGVAPTQSSLLKRRVILVIGPMIRLRLGDEAPTQLGPFIIIINKMAIFLNCSLFKKILPDLWTFHTSLHFTTIIFLLIKVMTHLYSQTPVPLP
jgi:hypothetical protein